jgi:hypothetical protein
MSGAINQARSLQIVHVEGPIVTVIYFGDDVI